RPVRASGRHDQLGRSWQWSGRRQSRLEPHYEPRHDLVGRRVAEVGIADVVVLRAAILEPRLERAGQLDLDAAAEAEPAGVLVELVERARRGERPGVERGVTDLAIGGYARGQREARAGADVVLPVGIKPFAGAGEAVGELGRVAAGRELALDADEGAAERQVV